MRSAQSSPHHVRSSGVAKHHVDAPACDVGEAGRVRPGEQEAARVGLAAGWRARRVSVQREPGVERGVGRVPGERGVVAVARGDHAAGLADAAHLAQRADRIGQVLQHLVRVHDVERCRRRSRARRRRRCGTRRWSRLGSPRSASAASIAAGATSMPMTCAGRDAVGEVERDRARPAADVEDRRARRRGGAAGTRPSSRRSASGASGAPPRDGRACSGRGASRSCGVGYGAVGGGRHRGMGRGRRSSRCSTRSPTNFDDARRGRRGGVRVPRRRSRSSTSGAGSPTRPPAGRGRRTRSCSCTRRRRASRRCAPTC